MARAKWASTLASMRSVLASRPVALAKSRTCRGLTTATGKPAPVSSPALDQGGNAGFVIGEARHLAIVQGGIQTRLGHVDTDVVVIVEHVVSPDSQPCRNGLAAL